MGIWFGRNADERALALTNNNKQMQFHINWLKAVSMFFNYVWHFIGNDNIAHTHTHLKLQFTKPNGSLYSTYVHSVHITVCCVLQPSAILIWIDQFVDEFKWCAKNQIITACVPISCSLQCHTLFVMKIQRENK